MMSENWCLTYGDGQDIHIPGFPTDRVSSIPRELCRVSYLRSRAEHGSSTFCYPDTFQDSLKIPLKVQRHARKCGTSDSDEGHAGRRCWSFRYISAIWELPSLQGYCCFGDLGAEVKDFPYSSKIPGDSKMDT
jgi:hypothetical protein